MEKINYGGPAFPGAVPQFIAGEGFSSGEPGMTLRDYYKGTALIGLLASGIAADGVHAPEIVADMCGKYADALIAERERGAKG